MTVIPIARDKELMKGYAIIGLVLLLLGFVFFVTQVSLTGNDENKTSKGDVKVELTTSNEVWENTFFVVKTPYSCPQLFEESNTGIIFKPKDVEAKFVQDDRGFTLNNAENNSEYRICSHTDYMGIIESSPFRIQVENETATVIGDRELRFKEYYEGSIRQTRNLEATIGDTRLQ